MKTNISRWLLLGALVLLFGLSFIPSPIALPLLYVGRIGLVLAIINIYLKPIFLPARFFWVMAGLAAFSVFSFFLPLLFPFAQGAVLVFWAVFLIDILILFNRNAKLSCERILPRIFSMGDENAINLKLKNEFGLPLKISIIDELPLQFQKRDFIINIALNANCEETVVYELRPTSRGEYKFNNINLFLRSSLGLAERRIVVESPAIIPVYPSVIQMKKYELLALARISVFPGVKKMRKLGHSYEFEQIREYVKGDDFRSINWKATSRNNSLMVNQYEDERSQQIFTVIDKGRSMKMPFNGLSLMDYAINASLVISNVALQKHDKVGLLTFSDKIGATIKPESGPKQLRVIIEALYREQERNFEGNFELLYQASKIFIRRRCLMFLYTNFESFSAMQRVLPVLRRINHSHLLVVIFFENTEIKDFAEKNADSTEDIYNKTIAMKFVEEKQLIVQELRQHGIQTILTRPEDLSINTVNKYLELKAKRMI
jgi:uncharacterized protein (DUF58 family)